MSESESLTPNPVRAAAAAMVKTLLSHPRMTGFSIIVILILMTVLVIFAKLTAIVWRRFATDAASFTVLMS